MIDTTVFCFWAGLLLISWMIANVAIKSFYLETLKSQHQTYMAEKEIERLSRICASQQDWMDHHECESESDEYAEEEDDEESLDPERN